MASEGAPTPSGVILGLVGLATHLVLGFFLAASGLVAPPWAVAIFLSVWLVMLVVGARQWRRRPWMAVAVPLATFAFWLAAVSLGDAFLGWTA